MKVILVAEEKGASRRKIVLDTFPALLGRCPEAAVRVSDHWASRRHCELDWVDGGLIVRDLGSRYGTLVNGSPISEAPLKPGDELAVGLTRFRVDYRQPAVKSTSDRDTKPIDRLRQVGWSALRRLKKDLVNLAAIHAKPATD